jgi:hypothetical protein
MIQLINTAGQTVQPRQSLLYNTAAVRSTCGKERQRTGSAFVTLLPPGRYLVTFSGNIAVPTGETVGEISLGITQDGEVLGGSVMRATPAAVEQYFNVSTQHYVDTYCNCCVNVGVQNTGDIPVLVDNPNITVVRVC